MGRVSHGPGLAPLGPAPGESRLTLQVPCSADPRALGAARHPVTIGPDWSVEVPHDLAAERVAVAFGGYCSCLELADRVVPAARSRLQALARREPPAVARLAKGGWSPRTPVAGCCARAAWAAGTTDPVAVTEHLRSNAHHAAAAGCRADLLRLVVRGLVRAHTGAGRFEPGPVDRALGDAVVHGRDGAARLWDAGIHPQTAAALHDLVAPGCPPLPVPFYLGVLAREQDLDWLGTTLATAVGPDTDPEPVADLADWLAWTATDLDQRHPTARGEYLRLGVPPQLVVELSLAGVTPAGVRRVAEATGNGPGVAAKLLAQWLAAGCGPDAEAVARVYRTGVPVSFRPSRAMLARAREELGRAGRGIPAVALAGLVGVAGSVPGAVAAVRRGVTDPVVLAAHEQGGTPGQGGPQGQRRRRGDHR